MKNDMAIIICAFASLVAVAIPIACFCSFIYGWGYFAQAALVFATFFDCGLVMFLMYCEVSDG